ncbi:lipid droplet-associated protein [Pseudonocardia sp. TRM90224]|uniref:lipid droplet-associated protein n=1 Tax=Pseudonocardia sp. TRM90224 TaxID=2812678 RepID=UPI001E38ADF5|nr:lipid droplet-associated protein [Pseudonocardia sp. TRM90224]
MKPLPLPVRIAAGLVATAVEQARDLPRMVVELPVTAVSQALQASMRVQQKVTELAIKGDRALGTLRPAEEKPAWATFDDEVDEPQRNGYPAVTELRPTPTPAPAPIPTPVPTGDVDAGGPNALPGYAELTIPQLRGRLRHLSLDDLRALLVWETSHENRAPYVTMLTNRITTVTEE